MAAGLEGNGPSKNKFWGLKLRFGASVDAGV